MALQVEVGAVAKLRLMHYCNQFFAGLGAEAKAGEPIGSLKGPAGPGRRLQTLLGETGQIIVTAYCGDDYFADHSEEALDSILKIAREYNIEMLVAGPAFASGRHGIACAEVCHSINASLGLHCISAMCADNPGADRYRLYQDQKVFLVPTAAALTGMEDAVQRMARLVRKLAGGASIGPAAEEGYVPRGIRINQFVAQTGAERAIDMLLAKMSGSAFTTEVPVISMSRAKVAPRIADLKGKLLALATTMGVIPPGNPDRFKVYHNDHWTKYPIAGLNSMTEGRWDIIHGGYNTVWAVQNPNYSVPLDACRRLEKEQVLGQLYPFFYMTSGAMGIIPVMQEIGRGMARDMLAEGVDATILVSAWGTDTRSGAVIAKEIEETGVPVVLVTSMTLVAKHTGANRIVTGTMIPHPCGDPSLPTEADLRLRQAIVECALEALRTEVTGPTIFVPKIAFGAK